MSNLDIGLIFLINIKIIALFPQNLNTSPSCSGPLSQRWMGLCSNNFYISVRHGKRFNCPPSFQAVLPSNIDTVYYSIIWVSFIDNIEEI